MRVVLFLSFLAGCPAPDGSGPGGENLDSDADGLLDSDEATYGTDPAKADSDGDGFNDKEEIDGGYSPTWEYSHMMEEGDYLIGNCPVHPDVDNAGPTGTGEYDTYTWDAYQEGDVMVNIEGEDSFGQDISLYTFCGDYVVLTQSAEWCGPCQALAATMKDDMEEIRAEVPNFTFFELLYQDNSGDNPGKRVLTNWKDDFELDGIPVMAPPDNTAEDMNWINASGGIPATLLIAPNGEVIWSGVNNPREYYLSSSDQILEAIADYED